MRPEPVGPVLQSATWRQTSQVNSQDVRRGNQAQFLGPGFGTGRELDPGAEWCAFAMFSGQSSETLEALILRRLGFRPESYPL